MESHPQVDIQPFLRGSSPYFQKFINDGLANLRKESLNNTNNNDEETTPRALEMDSNNPDYWMQKLNMYRVRGKLQSNEDRDSLMDNKIADENLNMNQIQSRTTTSTKKDVSTF
jgi:cytoskeleton-associated protein 5